MTRCPFSVEKKRVLWVSLLVKNALYFSANAFSSKVLIGDTIFTFPIGDGTAISRGHPSHTKV